MGIQFSGSMLSQQVQSSGLPQQYHKQRLKIDTKGRMIQQILIHRLIRRYFENLYFQKPETLEDIDKFLDTYELSKLNQKNIKYFNISNKETPRKQKQFSGWFFCSVTKVCNVLTITLVENHGVVWKELSGGSRGEHDQNILYIPLKISNKSVCVCVPKTRCIHYQYLLSL